MREFSHWYEWCEGRRHPETLYARVMRILETRGARRREAAYSSMSERICVGAVRPADYGWMDRRSHAIKTAFNILGARIQS